MTLLRTNRQEVVGQLEPQFPSTNRSSHHLWAKTSRQPVRIPILFELVLRDEFALLILASLQENG